jgi:hypothetical protein
MGKSRKEGNECKDHRGKAKLHEVVRHGDDTKDKEKRKHVR